MKKILCLGVLCAGVLGGAVWFSRQSVSLPRWVGKDARIPVHVVEMRKQKRSTTLRVSGKLAADAFEVRSRLAGKVAEVRFKAGDFVSTGTVVAIVESSQLTQTLAELQADLRAARESLKAKQEQLDNAQKQLERSQNLLRQNLIARNDVDRALAGAETARADAQLSEARVAQQEAMLMQARGLQKFTQVSTEVGGVVLARHVNPGATIVEWAPILSIANMATLRMNGVVPANWAAAITPGMKVKILLQTAEEKSISGKVVTIARPASEVERTALIEIGVSEGADLIPDMPVEALVHVEREAIWLPRSAIISEKGQGYAYKLGGQRAQRQTISLGATQDEEVEVVAGLKEGDWVIVDGINLLKSGTRVRVENSQAAQRSPHE